MKEVVFVRKNIDKWEKADEMCQRLDVLGPEKIADTYLEVSADLAFAQTHYPGSEIIPYLNAIALKMHNRIYGYRQQRLSRIVSFWTMEIPQEVYKHRRMMLLSVIIFAIGILIGVVSTFGNPDFTKYIMGQGYVEMTLQNISNGNPMGVYGSDNSHNMMLEITMNNIMVSFVCFVFGMLTCYMTGVVLLRNGVMLGTFMTFCYQHHVLSDCLLAMWLHGVFEITAILVSGGAGLVLGCGWMFPGSLPRSTSFRQAGKSGVKIVVGLIPLFVMAGVIESYVTRYTGVSSSIRLSFILLCLALMIFYFIYLPFKHRHG